MGGGVLLTDELADGDDKLFDAFVGLKKAFVGLTKAAVCFGSLFGYLVKAPAGFRGQVDDHFLKCHLIFGEDANDLFQPVDAPGVVLGRHNWIVA